MNPLTVVTAALRSIPSKYRTSIYLAFALAWIAVGAATVADVDTGKTIDVLAYLAPFLGFTAAANVDTASNTEAE